MASSTYQIISIVYKLLGDYSRRQLMTAARQPELSPPIRNALLALADAAATSEFDLVTKAERSKAAERAKAQAAKARHARTAGPSLSPRLPRSVYERNLKTFLSSKSRFQSKGDLVEFARQLDFNEPVDSKDSRKRVEQKIVKFAMTNEKFRQNLYELVPNDWSRQTSGWLELILQSRQ